MMRSVSTTLLVLLTTTAPAWAADYLTPGPDLRPSYPTQWEMGEDSGLHIEAGVRYWYSFGAQKHQIGPYTQTMDTKTHAGEVFVRVDDRPLAPMASPMKAPTPPMAGPPSICRPRALAMALPILAGCLSALTKPASAS